MNSESIIRLLKKEIEIATGCTEIGSIALAASKAAMELGALPEKVEVVVSPNFYKNAANVGVPGTQLRGIKISTALGCLLPNPNPGLDVLNKIDEDLISQAQQYLFNGSVKVFVENDKDPVYVKVSAWNTTQKTSVEIVHEHSFITQITKNDDILVSNSFNDDGTDPSVNLLKKYSLRDLIEFIQHMAAF